MLQNSFWTWEHLQWTNADPFPQRKIIKEHYFDPSFWCHVWVKLISSQAGSNSRGVPLWLVMLHAFGSLPLAVWSSYEHTGEPVNYLMLLSQITVCLIYSVLVLFGLQYQIPTDHMLCHLNVFYKEYTRRKREDT